MPILRAGLIAAGVDAGNESAGKKREENL